MALTRGVRPGGVTTAVAFEGATDEATFADLVEEVLVAGPEPGDVVARDRLWSHESEAAAEAVEGAGACLVAPPPWSPEPSPIDGMSSKVEGAKRSAAAWRKGAVDAAFGSALHDVTPGEIAG